MVKTIHVWVLSILLLYPAQSLAQPIEAFTGLPSIADPRISPDGSRLAFLGKQGDDRLLFVLDLETRTSQAIFTNDIRPRVVGWANNSIVLLSASEVQDVFRRRADVSAILSVNVDDEMTVRQLLDRSRRLSINTVTSNIVGYERDRGRLIIPVRDEDGNYSLFSVDPETDYSSRLERGRGFTIDWIVDEQGDALARLDYYISRGFATLYTYQNGNAVAIYEQSNLSRPPFNLVGQGLSGEIVVSTSTTTAYSDERSGLYILTDQGDLDELFVHERFDLDHTVSNPYTNRVIGAAYYDENSLNRVWFDSDFQAVNDRIDEHFEAYGLEAEMIHWTEDLSAFVLAVEGGQAAPAFYLYNSQSGEVNLIGSQYPDVAQSQLANRISIEYPARDGTRIPAYLTIPAGEGPHPSVILPHGGPASRDVGGFDWFAHFLASRGYLVLQPNFRGSSGYGQDWRQAGNGEWGRGVMQNDLHDGLQVLIEEGYSDPDRVCIVGASYGGYAALAGATFTPDEYKCAVAIAPVSDLSNMITFVRERYGRRHWLVDYWRDSFAGSDENSTRDLLNYLSPARHADAVQVPILLIHGRDDTVVPIDQSELMARELDLAGKLYSFIEVESGDHWLTGEEMRFVVLSNLERFLEEHIGE